MSRPDDARTAASAGRAVPRSGAGPAWTARPATLAERDASGLLAIPLHGWQGGRAGQGHPHSTLRVAVVVNASQAMTDSTAQLASLAWIIADSAHRYIDVGASARTVVVRVGREVDLLGEPLSTEQLTAGRAHPVLGFGLDTDHARLDVGLRIAETTLGLHSPGPRLVVLITGVWAVSPECMDRTRATLARLRSSGCRVLWLCPAPDPCSPDVFPGAFAHLIDDERYRLDSRYTPRAWTELGTAALFALTGEFL